MGWLACPSRRTGAARADSEVRAEEEVGTPRPAAAIVEHAAHHDVVEAIGIDVADAMDPGAVARRLGADDRVGVAQGRSR